MRTNCLEVELLRSTRLHLPLPIASLERNSKKILLTIKNCRVTIEEKRFTRKYRQVMRTKMQALSPRENEKMQKIEVLI